MAHLNPWQSWTEALAAELSKKGFSVSASEMVAPPKPELGDVSVPFFRLAKTRGESPAALAQQAGEALGGSHGSLIASAEAAGPYLNVRFSDAALSMAVTDLLVTESLSAQTWRAAVSRAEAGTYGRLASTGQAPILFEYANPNTHKEIHIGHLRNFVTGVAYHSLWKAAGIPVVAVQFINDQGANVAKALWGFLRLYWSRAEDLRTYETDEGNWPAARALGRTEPKSALSDECFTKYGTHAVPMARELGRIYAEAGNLVEELGDHAKAEISYVQTQLEQGRFPWKELWIQTRAACIEEIGQICDEMEIGFDRPAPYLESSFLEESARIVDQLESEGAIATRSEGALVVNLEAEKLGICLLRKSDGNLLYLSKDLALAEQKKRDYPDASASFVLTDDRQSLHFKQLNAVLQKIGYGRPYGHLGYGLLTLKEGAMSSRKGNIVTYQSLRDDLLAHAVLQINLRHVDPAWDVSRVNSVAHDIAFGGMKFALLKQDPKSVFLFDKEQALSFEGMTGPYCQYAFVRLFSILEKAGSAWEVPEVATEPLTPAERALILALATLPDTVARAAGRSSSGVDVQQTQPALLAQWCFTTAQAVNAFYRDTPVLDAAPAVRARRLDLALAAACALRNGLRILTIPVPTAM